ncbi:transmembrane amino acid transporter protein-domain-containing protein [Hyaloraphidium curvatum]|nr:transmembrane amino acid transporter protein-domain-containing protein [Hyaloraphidium curvatum]
MQSLFNSANILVGIGVLSLPFALRLTSFAVGLGLLAVFCILTLYTARVLARLVDLAGDVTTYADVGQMALGNNGRIFIAYFFLTELVCASVALIILASDSIHALIPSWHPYTVKLALFLVVAPTTWPRSLGFLSYFSLLGIVSSLNLMAITFYLGLSTPEAPGSLHEPADGVEWLLPRSWMGMPLATGLLMGSFAGHAVFPSIYVDMEDRKGYPALITLTYGMLVVLYGALAAAGYYMFGSSTAQEITLNFARTPAYPPALVHWTVALVAINPLSKFALTLSPVNAFLERALLPPSLSSATRAALRTASRTAVAAAVFLVAALFPAFERAMGVLGSLFSFTVSAAFPCACVLVLASSGGMRVSLAERIACGVILVASVVLGASGTLWSVMGWA